jgi:hypothetical protein
MNFINPEFNFKNKSRDIKTRDIHKLYFLTTLSIFELDIPWKCISSSNFDRCISN